MLKQNNQKLQRVIRDGSKEDAVKWARELIINEHLPQDDLFKHVTEVIEKWFNQEISVAEARKEAFKIHALARACDDYYKQCILRAYGHLVATIHVKEHALRCYQYILKARDSKGV